MPDYTLCSGVHVCWSEHSDLSFVYGFMSLDYGFGTMTATTTYILLFFATITLFMLSSGVHVCWSEHSDLSFVYGFMSLDYGFGTMTATTTYILLFFATITLFMLSVWADMLEKFRHRHCKMPHLIRVYTVCHSLSSSMAADLVLHCLLRSICSNT